MCQRLLSLGRFDIKLIQKYVQNNNAHNMCLTNFKQLVPVCLTWFLRCPKTTVKH